MTFFDEYTDEQKEIMRTHRQFQCPRCVKCSKERQALICETGGDWSCKCCGYKAPVDDTICTVERKWQKKEGKHEFKI